MVLGLYSEKSWPVWARSSTHIFFSAFSVWGVATKGRRSVGCRARAAKAISCAGMLAGGSTKSANSVARALRGMPSNSADSGLCTSTRPPACLMARMPSVPSLPVPDSTTPTACSCRLWASEVMKKSTGRRSPRGALGVSNCRVPLISAMSQLGGIT